MFSSYNKDKLGLSNTHFTLPTEVDSLILKRENRKATEYTLVGFELCCLCKPDMDLAGKRKENLVIHTFFNQKTANTSDERQSIPARLNLMLESSTSVRVHEKSQIVLKVLLKPGCSVLYQRRQDSGRAWSTTTFQKYPVNRIIMVCYNFNVIFIFCVVFIHL